ncbi:hypothetical protein HDU76_014004 [Blyttiomyces sp. JEL0837]|nr:hypothetical protein HDU76_014004 [Blyttiomyces sp. JEL0837]
MLFQAVRRTAVSVATARTSIRTFHAASISRTRVSLVPGGVIEAHDEDFKDILKAGGSNVLLVDFYANWCGPCRMLAPILKKVVSEDGKAVLVKVNVDEAEEIASEFNISSLPTVAAFKDGKIVDQFIGLRDEAAVKKFLKDVN